MKTNKLKMIMTIFFTIFILCILSLTVNATNEEIEILEKLETEFSKRDLEVINLYMNGIEQADIARKYNICS